MNYDNLHTQIIIRRIIVGTRYEHIENGRPIKHTVKQNTEQIQIQDQATHKEIRKNNIKRLKAKSKTKQVSKSKIPVKDDERRTKQRLPKPQWQLTSKILQRIFRVIQPPDIFAEA